MSKLLVAYDGSPGANRALDRTASLAGEGDVVTIINVVPAFVQARALARHERERNIKRREAEAARARRTLFERGVPSTILVVEGDPARKICATAEREGYDLIVIGTRHLHGIQRFARGSVSSEVIRHAPCDVIVVH